MKHINNQLSLIPQFLDAGLEEEKKKNLPLATEFYVEAMKTAEETGNVLPAYQIYKTIEKDAKGIRRNYLKPDERVPIGLKNLREYKFTPPKNRNISKEFILDSTRSSELMTAIKESRFLN